MAPRLIRKVLVANRGEIACRVIRTCHAMGIATVAVYSDADASARHVREANEAVRIGAPPATSSYLNIPILIAAAHRTGADAVHPGYGFLAENADFANACRDANLIFIGPRPEVIARMGSKRESKLLMAAAGVPVIPGYAGDDQSDACFLAKAGQIGYPVLVKASAGGGGKGMRVVERAEELPAALAAARREALAAFGDETLLLEKLLVEPRHVEFQIFGDEQGHLIHLSERECSIQRRHQKVIEETPSTALAPDLRAHMGAAAVLAGLTLGYTNAGTIEFILDTAGNFYFLEVNTRLQVEHPVTELVTGLDLVRWQIQVAEGRPLPLSQEQVTFTGHAVEARVYAEDPASGFLPATGPVVLWREPEGEGIRVDAGIATGDVISPYYDPLLAKISAHGADRAEALRRLERALATTVFFGPRNNLDFLRRALLHPAHLAGQISTAFIERHGADLIHSASYVLGTGEDVATAALVAALRRLRLVPGASRWRNNPGRPVIEYFSEVGASAGGAGGGRIEVRLTPSGPDVYAAICMHAGNETRLTVVVREEQGDELALEVDGHRLRALAVPAEVNEWWVRVGAATHALRRHSPLAERDPGAAGPIESDASANGRRPTAEVAHRPGAVVAPMPGQVVSVLVVVGQPVVVDEPLVILEAMKMEHTLRAPHAGVVEAVHFNRGEQVPAAAVLLDLRPAPVSETSS